MGPVLLRSRARPAARGRPGWTIVYVRAHIRHALDVKKERQKAESLVVIALVASCPPCEKGCFLINPPPLTLLALIAGPGQGGGQTVGPPTDGPVNAINDAL